MHKEMQGLKDQLYPKTKADEIREAIQKQDGERDQGDMQVLLKLPEGRRFLWRMINSFGLFHHSITGEAMTTGFNLGRRDAALFLVAAINVCDHNAYAQMQGEHFSKVNSENAQIEKLGKEEEGDK